MTVPQHQKTLAKFLCWSDIKAMLSLHALAILSHKNTKPEVSIKKNRLNHWHSQPAASLGQGDVVAGCLLTGDLWEQKHKTTTHESVWKRRAQTNSISAFPIVVTACKTGLWHKHWIPSHSHHPQELGLDVYCCNPNIKVTTSYFIDEETEAVNSKDTSNFPQKLDEKLSEAAEESAGMSKSRISFLTIFFSPFRDFSAHDSNLLPV